jgi:hypothetical protein
LLSIFNQNYDNIIIGKHVVHVHAERSSGEFHRPPPPITAPAHPRNRHGEHLPALEENLNPDVMVMQSAKNRV